MGMYTGLRVIAKVKEEFIPELEKVLSPEYEEYVWSRVDTEKFPFVSAFSKEYRASFIPFGAVCYMPYDWDEENSFADGVWVFTCSLKNYGGLIEMFIEDVLVNIVDVAFVEKLYEEESESALFYIEDGEIILSRKSKLEYQGYF